MNVTAKTAEVCETLQDLQAHHEISIIKLSEPLLLTSSSSATAQDASDAQQQQQQQQQRTSDASNNPGFLDGPTPASLEIDLAHYTELFAKLRFSYVEQVTKEKFIRAIVGDPPLIVTSQENLELEAANASAKAQLKSLKVEVARMVADLERQARELSRRHGKVQLETAELRDLPEKCAQLQASMAAVRAASQQQQQQQHHHNTESSSAHPDMNLPLSKTWDLVNKRKLEQQELARELGALQAKLPRKVKEAERLRAEMQPLENKRQNSVSAAKEARRRKEAALGGVADDLEQRARWWRASENVLKQVLDV